jgi:archaeal flagellin FlaB
LSGIEGYILTRFRIGQTGAIGIGAMIVFIAMVLVAGIAAYIMLSTGSQLEIRSSTTGRQTITEVSTGVKITLIQGHNTSGKINKMIISITPRPGTQSVSLDKMLVELANSTVKCVLKYSSGNWVDARSGTQDIFSAAAFSTSAGQFGVIVIKDDDGSCSQNTPVINSGDSVMLSFNTTSTFNGLESSTNILGNIMPEEGAWSIIQFRTPSGYANPIVVLYED